jgi:hypothetical protein
MTSRFMTSAVSLSWLNRLQSAAVGRATIATLLVEYDVYAIRLRAAETA